jgi:probable F420-dependent oxidoreductase
LSPTVELGRIGLWSGPLRRGGDVKSAAAAAAEIERLGFRTAWMPGGEDGLEAHLRALLGATSRLILGLGIINIWFHEPEDVAEINQSITKDFGKRLLVGVGVGHAPLVDRDQPGRYKRPLESTSRYLDALDAATHPIPPEDRVLAAFSTKMMDLARDRTRGAVPYLVTPGHTKWSRSLLGTGPLLAVEQHVILETDPAVARRIGREYVATYLGLPNYLNNFRRMGFTDEDFEHGGSDRLVDELMAWGDVDAAITRAQQHFDAGADHVGLQVLTPGKSGFPVAAWRTLADAFRPMMS